MERSTFKSGLNFLWLFGIVLLILAIIEFIQCLRINNNWKEATGTVITAERGRIPESPKHTFYNIRYKKGNETEDFFIESDVHQENRYQIGQKVLIKYSENTNKTFVQSEMYYTTISSIILSLFFLSIAILLVLIEKKSPNFYTHYFKGDD